MRTEMKNTKSIIKIVVILFLLNTAFIPEVCFGKSQKPKKVKNGMVVTVSTPASLVGIQILKDGGNAVDAAVVVGFALAVTYPYVGNIAQSAAVMKRCNVFVSNDSGLMHIAASQKLKIVSIIGSTNTNYIHPWKTENKIASLNLECSLCFF